MSPVGFEPTRSKTLRPERNPLDHSGKLTHELHQLPTTFTNAPLYMAHLHERSRTHNASVTPSLPAPCRLTFTHVVRASTHSPLCHTSPHLSIIFARHPGKHMTRPHVTSHCQRHDKRAHAHAHAYHIAHQRYDPNCDNGPSTVTMWVGALESCGWQHVMQGVVAQGEKCMGCVCA